MQRFRSLTGEGVVAQHEPQAMTVSQLNEYVRSLLAKSPLLSDVTVRGEISNFTFHRASGHLYFSLKDADGILSAVMFRSSAQRLRFQPETGMKVLARGTMTKKLTVVADKFSIQAIKMIGLAGGLAQKYKD